MSCYSDHNEDIRTKGSCDYCYGTTPESRRYRVYWHSKNTGRIGHEDFRSPTLAEEAIESLRAMGHGNVYGVTI